MDHVEDEASITRNNPRFADAFSLHPASAIVSPRQASSSVDAEFLEASVDAAVSGNRAALAHLLGYIHPLVVRYCRARLSSGHRSLSGADDIAQEVCMAVMSALPTYRRDGRPFLAFVYAIASHK